MVACFQKIKLDLPNRFGAVLKFNKIKIFKRPSPQRSFEGHRNYYIPSFRLNERYKTA